MDQARRRASLDKIDQNDAAARRLYFLGADNGLDRVVASLDQDIGLEPPDQLDRRLLVKADYGIDRLDRGDHGGAVGQSVDRTFRSLEPSYAAIGIQRDDQPVALRAGRRQQRDMPGMYDVENAI